MKRVEDCTTKELKLRMAQIMLDMEAMDSMEYKRKLLKELQVIEREIIRRLE